MRKASGWNLILHDSS